MTVDSSYGRTVSRIVRPWVGFMTSPIVVGRAVI